MKLEEIWRALDAADRRIICVALGEARNSGALEDKLSEGEQYRLFELSEYVSEEEDNINSSKKGV